MKNENIIIAIVIALVIIILFSGIFGYNSMGFGMMQFYYPMMLLGTLISVLIVIALVLFIMWLIKQLGLKK